MVVLAWLESLTLRANIQPQIKERYPGAGASTTSTLKESNRDPPSPSLEPSFSKHSKTPPLLKLTKSPATATGLQVKGKVHAWKRPTTQQPAGFDVWQGVQTQLGGHFTAQFFGSFKHCLEDIPVPSSLPSSRSGPSTTEAWREQSAKLAFGRASQSLLGGHFTTRRLAKLSPSLELSPSSGFLPL